MIDPSDPGSQRELAFARLAALGRRYASERSDRWAPVAAELDARIAADAELRAAALAARRFLARDLEERLGAIDPALLDAMITVPRERFVMPEDIDRSADDMPLSLDPSWRATISAPHAYVLTYRLLGLRAGDRLLELGTGTGYGAALARALVGASGKVTTIEIDRALLERAERLLAADGDAVEALLGSGCVRALEILGRPNPPERIAVTFALRDLPREIEAAIPEGGVLVAPIGHEEDRQALVRLRRRGTIERTMHGDVRYVADRSR